MVEWHFVACYRPENRHQREPGQRFRICSYDELMARDKASLDVFWLKDDSLDNLAGLRPPGGGAGGVQVGGCKLAEVRNHGNRMASLAADDTDPMVKTTAR